MRVCILTPEFLPTWGGIGTYAYNLARGLRDRAEVHVVTSDHARSRADPEPLDGVQVHAIHGDGGRPGRLGLGFQLAVFRRLPRLAQTHHFDIVHSNHAYMSDLLVRARNLPSAIAVTVHTTIGTQVEGTLRAGESVPHHTSERTIARWRLLLRAIERRYLRKTAAMIFVSKWVRDHAVTRYGLTPRHSEIIPNGIDTERLAWTDRTPEAGSHGNGEWPTLLFAGRLLALKGIDTLLRAMTRVSPSVRLLLAGPGEPAPWRALANRLGLDRGRCQFLGAVPYEAMPSLYRQADAVVLPSFSESCPMVALEAMASGTPLIASAAGGIGEIVQELETGWLFPAGDAEGLANRIETVLSDPARARAVAERARSWVEDHASIDRMAESTLRFYERTVCGEAS